MRRDPAELDQLACVPGLSGVGSFRHRSATDVHAPRSSLPVVAEQRLQWRGAMAGGERARDRLALRCIEVTRRDAHRTLSEAHPADRVELPFDIDRRALELLTRLRDQLPPDSAAWSALEALERSIDLGLVGAIPIGADTDVVEALGEQAGATSDR